MEIIVRAATAAVIGSILALVLKKNAPELSLMTALATGLSVVFLAIHVYGSVSDTLRKALEISGTAVVYVSPVIKCVGIGLVSNLAGQICQDAQQKTAASAVELCGAVCALYAALPLVDSLLSVVEKLV